MTEAAIVVTPSGTLIWEVILCVCVLFAKDRNTTVIHCRYKDTTVGRDRHTDTVSQQLIFSLI